MPRAYGGAFEHGNKKPGEITAFFNTLSVLFISAF